MLRTFLGHQATAAAELEATFPLIIFHMEPLPEQPNFAPRKKRTNNTQIQSYSNNGSNVCLVNYLVFD
jgi:hypothetical protein